MNYYKKNNFKYKTIIFVIIQFIIILIINKFNIFIDIRKSIIEKINNYIYMNIYKTKNSIYNLKKNFNYKSKIIIENNKLKKKIDLYKTKNLILNKYLIENIKLKNILNIPENKNNIISSKVININYSKLFITINKGINSKINIGNPVLTKDGIIGQIVNINKNFSKVLLTTNRQHYIPSKINRNNLKLILKGCGYKNELYIYNNIDILNNDDLKTGDIIISSGLDNKFPENIPVAIIKNIVIKNNRINNISIKPIFYNKPIDYVFIINNK